MEDKNKFVYFQRTYLFYSLYFKLSFLSFFFFNDSATTEIYTLSLHDALPIFAARRGGLRSRSGSSWSSVSAWALGQRWPRERRSEEHTSELQSRRDLVCRLLLEKKKEELVRCLADKNQRT